MTQTEWVRACSAGDVEFEDVMPYERGGVQYAIFRSATGDFYATDGWCTHERAALCDGLVMDNTIECPRHNGRFDFTTGRATAIPAIAPLATYPVRVVDGEVQINVITDAGQ